VLLISVHMPKTAGLSFRASLEQHFGDGFRHDYQDYPLAQSATVRRDRALAYGKAVRVDEFAGVSCIHGHFLPLKYLPLADQLACRFVTWLREPFARLVSHYDYWQRTFDPASSQTSALHRRVIEEGWSLQRFCLAPELRNVYTEFLWGVPVERLFFIGITEFFAEDLRYFSQHVLGNKMQPHTLNRRPDNDAALPGPDHGVIDRRAITEYHAADMALYRQALRLRQRRLDPSIQAGQARL
jgi:hypothetical protein